MESDKGIVYLFAYSLDYSERMAVSLHTLRNHWRGPVTVLADKVTEDMAQRIAGDTRIGAEVILIEPFQGSRHANYVTKTMIPWKWTPHRRTLLIDGDTSVHGSLDQLFEYPLVITSFSDWCSCGRVSGRCKWWLGKGADIEELVRIQLSHPWPAINTGVVGWWREHFITRRWHELTLRGRGTHMTDEIAMQLLLSELKDQVTILDDRWNSSPTYGKNMDDVRIWHYHGGKHFRKPECRILWEPLLRQAMEENIGGVGEWAGKYDPAALKILNGEPSPVPV